ncbi:chromate efflux transporter [Paenibacillus sp. PL91]|uniref:chromate efflux transporter n=1 Tax=Paenibacillus sp. PL91 TaxID=2729538 RepID=UPI00145C8E33|nr:chromate efflux transporter [Paenibacillus sp. PL91]MBC9198978.1 chromate efflux transporter [Paenibacillus sp. PL91]
MNKRVFSFAALWEVFWTACKLGVTSFGGPIAHIGYFRDEYVVRRQWLNERAFADLVTLCQFLPGPASSQLGMAIGVNRAGIAGAIAAWLGFTLPSAMLMVAFAYGADILSVSDAGWLQGLKLAAVAIVAQAVWSMSRTLAPDRLRGTLALGAAGIAILVPGMYGQLLPLVLCAVIGLLLLKPQEESVQPEKNHLPQPIGRVLAGSMLMLFFLLLLVLPIISRWTGASLLSFIDGIYRAGSLVFGGGHVVLPMLEAEFLGTGAGQLTNDQFMSGYGAVQAVPGPLFTFAAYIGAALQQGPMRIVYAGIALIAIFLPSFLLVIGALPFWEALKQNKAAQAALRGINAGIVGILLAALYDPIFVDTVSTSIQFVFVIVLFIFIQLWKRPPWQAVLLAAIAGLLFL